MRNLLFCRHRACPGDLDAKSASDREGRVKPGPDKTVLRPSIWAREQKFLPEPPATVADDGVFEGYASLFGIADLGKDVVAPGAFAETLARRGPPGVRMLWQQDPAEPIGRWLSLAKDARGLRVRGKLNLAVARARELHALMKDGGVDGLSIGFRVERARAEQARGPAPAGAHRPVGDLPRHLPDAAGSQGERREAGPPELLSPRCGERPTPGL